MSARAPSAELSAAIADHAADVVVEVPWSLQQERQALMMTRGCPESYSTRWPAISLIFGWAERHRAAADLNAAGQLVLIYHSPGSSRILEYFDSPPWTLEFERKFCDSPSLVARYRRSLNGISRFLRDSGDIEDE